MSVVGALNFMPNKSVIKNFDNDLELCFNYLYNQKSILSIADQKPSIFEIIRNYSQENTDFKHKYPYTLIFKLTSDCNLRCKHCFFYNQPQKYCPDKDLTYEQIHKILKYFIEEANIVNCILTGGEIFTLPHLKEIIKYIKSSNVILELLTNGTLINKDYTQFLCDTLNKKTDHIQISLDGTEEINDLIRGKGNFQKTINNIRDLTDKGIKVCVALTLNSSNINNLEQIYELCCSIGVYQLNLGKVIICNPEQEYLRVKTRDIITNISKILRINEKYNMRIKIRALKIFDFIEFKKGQELLDKILKNNQSNNLDKNYHCKVNDEQVTIFANGDVSLCYDCDQEEMYIGNLKDQTFDEIWSGKDDKLMFQYRSLDKNCKNCDYISLCNGGCPYAAYNKYKTINAPDGNCTLAAKMIQAKKWEI